MARIKLTPDKKPWELAVGTETTGIVDVLCAEAQKRFRLSQPDISGPTALERLFTLALNEAFMDWIKGLDWRELQQFGWDGDTLISAEAVSNKVWNQYQKGKIPDEKFAEALELIDCDELAKYHWTLLVNRDSGQFLVLEVSSVTNRFAVYGDHVLAKALYAQQALSKFNRAKRVRASSVGDCQRQLWFDLARAKEDEPEGKPEWKIVAAIGTVLHEVLEDLLTTSDLVSRQEFLVEIEGIFGGKVDAELDIDGQKYILDWKTVAHKDFLRKEKLWKIEKYVNQLSSYGNLLGIHKAVVVLVDRNTSELLEVPLNLDPNLGEELLEKAHEVRDLVDHLVVPAPVFSGGCRFCNFVRQCSAEEESQYVSNSIAAGVPLFRI